MLTMTLMLKSFPNPQPGTAHNLHSRPLRMAKFTDHEGEEWTIALTLGTVRRLKRERDYDVCDMRTVLSLLNSWGECLDLAFILSKEERKALQVNTIDEWEQRCLGQAGAACREAVLDALESFSRKMGQESMAQLIRESRNQIHEAAAGMSGATSDADTQPDESLTQPSKAQLQGLNKPG